MVVVTWRMEEHFHQVAQWADPKEPGPERIGAIKYHDNYWVWRWLRKGAEHWGENGREEGQTLPTTCACPASFLCRRQVLHLSSRGVFPPRSGLVPQLGGVWRADIQVSDQPCAA